MAGSPQPEVGAGTAEVASPAGTSGSGAAAAASADSGAPVCSIGRSVLSDMTTLRFR